MAQEQSRDMTFTRLAMSAEMLDADTEYDLACAWRDHHDEAALHRLTTAYMRLALAMARKFKGYGASPADLVQEANVGLMKAAMKFDPERGVRFSTYAIWWIKASLQEYVLRNWSVVRTGSSSAQKSLFFNLRRVQAQLVLDAGKRGFELDQSELNRQSAELMGVSIRDTELMNARFVGGDQSLNALKNGREPGREMIDFLKDETVQAAERVGKSRDRKTLRRWLAKALMRLSARERFILKERKLREKPRTLASLGQELGLSKERVRQVERGALIKMREILTLRHFEPAEFLG